MNVLSIYLQKTRPRDKLSHEEVLPFVEVSYLFYFHRMRGEILNVHAVFMLF